MSVLAFLKKPYPFYTNSKEALRLVFVISVFIGLFCYVFSPFGIEDSLVQNHLLMSAGFGLVTLITSMFNMVFLPRLLPGILSDRRWTVYKELLWVIWMLLAIAFMNWIYANIFYEQPEFDLLSFAVIAAYTIVVGLMPAMGVILFKQSRSLKKQIHEVSQQIQTTREGVVHFVSESARERLSVPRNQVLLITAAGNYSEIFYHEGEQILKGLIRNKISNLEVELREFPEIIRCHRKHIINVDKIMKIDGNSQGSKLRLFHLKESIPVSRSYTQAVNQVRNST